MADNKFVATCFDNATDSALDDLADLSRRAAAGGLTPVMVARINSAVAQLWRAMHVDSASSAALSPGAAPLLDLMRGQCTMAEPKGATQTSDALAGNARSQTFSPIGQQGEV